MQPKILQAKFGTSATFTCDSVSPLTWYFNNSILPFHVYQAGKSIFINSVQEYDSGKYTCVGQDNLGFQFLAVGTLEVVGMWEDHFSIT